MNYKRIYDCIVERGKNRKLKDYKEVHHIIPRCMGGTNLQDNLVELTAREHYICHKLLVEIYPKEDKLIWGYWMMAMVKGRGQDRSYQISAREYERLRQKYCEVLKKRVPWNKGLTKEDPRVAKYASTPRWNKGKTKSTDDRVADHARITALGRKGRVSPMKGKTSSKKGEKYSHMWLLREELIVKRQEGWSYRRLEQTYKCSTKTIKKILLI